MDNAQYNQEFKESFRKIALPVGLQNILFISLNFVDSLMVGRLGQTEFNAVGLGGQYYFLINLFVVGTASASVIYMSQYFGNDDIKGYRKSSGLAILSCLIIGLLAGGLAILLPAKIMRIFTEDSAVINSGIRYLSIIGFQLPIMSVMLPLAMASRASRNAKLPLIISSISLISNTALNYLLIFGKFGFPKFGVSGAALATLISSALALLLYVIIINTTQNALRGSLKDFLNIDKAFIAKVYSTGWTVIVHECLWSLGISLFVLILSRTSTDGYTSYQIASKFVKFSFIFIMAISSSASVTIGMLLGRKDIDKALIYEKMYSKTQVVINTVVAILIVVITYYLVDLFKVSEAIKSDAFYTTIALCLFLPLKSYSGMQAAGILRAGGDTKIPVFMELAGTYLVDVPVLYILLNYSNLTTPQIIFFASSGSILTSILLYRRVKSKKWAKNLISE